MFRTLLVFLLALLPFAAFAQVNVRPPTLDVAATRVRLLALSDEPVKTKEILAEDEQAFAPLVPYSVLVRNDSDRKLKSLAVKFSWPSGMRLQPTKSLTIVMAMMMNAQDPTQLAPSEHRIVTPLHVINQYLGLAPQDRKRGHFKTGTAAAPVSPGASSVGERLSYPSLAETITQGLGRFGIQSTSGFEATLEGVVFDDYSYVGSEMIFQSLVRYDNLIHR